MRDIIEQPPEPGAPAPPLWRRVVWFAVLAFTGAFSTAAIAYVLKLLLR
jgi:hypothetical protein